MFFLFLIAGPSEAVHPLREILLQSQPITYMCPLGKRYLAVAIRGVFKFILYLFYIYFLDLF
jgi:hypothetical protein